MASERQIEANRLNAQASTGPRTIEGKVQSSRNAVKHGLTARGGLLADEDPEEYIRLYREVINDLRPEDEAQLQLAERIFSLMWRLARVPRFEAALLAHFEARATGLSSSISRSTWIEGERRIRSDGEVRQLILGQTIKDFLETGIGEKLGRYETGMLRHLSILLKELREIQAQAQKTAEHEVALRKSA